MIHENFNEMIGKGALLCATDKDGGHNPMTVSWGARGILWGKDVCFVFVRHSRYTYQFSESGSTMTLSFFDESRKDTLAFCGTKTGRDVDKFRACDLKFDIVEGGVVFKDAKRTLILKKLYCDDVKKECFTDMEPLKWYKDNDFHRVYVCEVIKEI
ncbi:MAG: flavin reductase family protein [Clostridia bacterium]|nr:flavin reductase family protein [Clostridia bacterium]MBQ7907828.1 flavin reductase family protein [Clostridia bacterium]